MLRKNTVIKKMNVPPESCERAVPRPRLTTRSITKEVPGDYTHALVYFRPSINGRDIPTMFIITMHNIHNIMHTS